MSFNLLVLSCLIYVALLFAIAFMAERQAARDRTGPHRWLSSPLVYTLSLSIYCTAWTFFGAVGYAARSGLEFLTIYLGPTLVFVGWWWVLRKLVRIGRQQRVTSIADMISSRYGKSSLLGVIVTVICVVAATPYIALQLQSVTLSFGVFASAAGSELLPGSGATALWVAGGLALFTVLFGTRNLDANEQHTGVVIAIAVEAVVKLVALVAVGLFVIWGIADGPADIMARIDSSRLATWEMVPSRWIGLIALSAAAVITLPRMFQVLVVECGDERNLITASWAFPAYLALMSIFVVPIAVIGLEQLPEGSNPDIFVLTLPLAFDQGALAMLAFLGGFSSATSMVIVAAIALATMVSNHIVMPLWLSLRPARGVTRDVRRLVLNARRLSIAGVLGLGYCYYSLTGGSAALATIGLISFVGVAQMVPAMLGGLFWRGATRSGAIAGLCAGFALWCYTLLLPGADVLPQGGFPAQGPFGLDWLQPRALFGLGGMDPILHSAFWSLSINASTFLIVSLMTFPGPVERVQGLAFVNVFDIDGAGLQSWNRGGTEPEELLKLAQRILGDEPALAFFEQKARDQGIEGYLPDPTPDFLAGLERKLGGTVGAAAAHAMVAELAGHARVTVADLIRLADETAQIMEYSSRLETQQAELERTARQLREANEKLTQLSVQKDAFLSQISHELRTPMTSIRAFSEILMESDLPPEAIAQARIIHEEARRLTRLLDDLLDLSVLENGTVQLDVRLVNLSELIERALAAAAQTRPERIFELFRDRPAEAIFVRTDPDRLAQVFINLIANARKYCDAARPELRIQVHQRGQKVVIDFIDNGSGISKAEQQVIFEKFARLTDLNRAGGAGLGLAICREIMGNLGGSVTYLPARGGAAFRVTLPVRLRMTEEKASPQFPE